MSWEYRVMRRKEKDGSFIFGMHEVYDNGLWTEDAVGPLGDTIEDLKKDLEFMQAALAQPVMDYETGKPIEDQ